ncbi:MAG TPA: hypothetical protein VH497_07895 [Vicinamibacterales bacterium]|jgi:hypothetical protein
MNQRTRKTWVSIVIAALIISGLVVVGFVGGAYVFLRSHLHGEDVEPAQATAQIAEIRQRFIGAVPLIEIASDGQPVLHRNPTGERRPVKVFHVVQYDERAGHMSRIDLPGWVVRAASAGGRIRLANLGFSDDSDDDDQQRLTLEDLERHGPGLVLDVARRGGRVLAWTE